MGVGIQGIYRSAQNRVIIFVQRCVSVLGPSFPTSANWIVYIISLTKWRISGCIV